MSDPERAQAIERESEASLVFDLLPEATYLIEVTPEGRFRVRRVNPAFERLVGLPAAALVGRTIEETVPPATADLVVAKYRACAELGRPTEVSVVLDLPVGRRVFRSVLIPRVGADGRVDAIVGVSRDVTHERETPGAESGEFRGLVESSPDQIGRYDAEGRYLYVNPAGLHAIGRPWEALAGRRPSEVSSSRAARDVELAVRACARDDKPFAAGVRVETPDGVAFLDLRLTPERNRLGEVVSVVAVGHDMTALKRAELEFRTLAENAPDIIARFDRDGRYLYVNRAIERMTGVPVSDFIGRVAGELRTRGGDAGAAADVAPLLEAIREVWMDERPRRVAVELPAIGGRRTLDVHLVPEHAVDGRLESILGIATDVSARERAEASLRRINRVLETLSSGNEALVRAESEPELLDWMCRVLVQVGEHRAAWIGLVDPAAPAAAVHPAAWAGEGLDETAAAALAAAGGPSYVASALSRGRPIVLRASAGAPLREAPIPGDEPIRSVLAAPLFDGATPRGVMVACASAADAFDPDEVTLLAELASDVSYGLGALRLRSERAEHAEHLERAMQATIQALANTLDLRDPYTAGHQRRVTVLAVALGRRLGLDDARLQGLRFASVVHDIGKISVPAEILTRPGRLSALEYAIVQTHVEAGYDILKGIDFPWPIAEIVRQHHERYDGSGYPRQLCGDAILLEARVLAVCDVAEAMSSHRPYRASLGVDAALAELARGRGLLYDPAVVDACAAVFADGFSFG